MKENPWARLLAYVTGLINQELLLKNDTFRYAEIVRKANHDEIWSHRDAIWHSVCCPRGTA
jgi:hypothetical protein